MSIKIESFDGIAPKVNDPLLSANMAISAVNLRVDSGSIKPLRGLTAVATITNTARSIYNYEYLAGTFQWLNWTVQGINVIKSMVPNDLYYRIYYTGDGYPKYTFSGNTNLTTGNPNGFVLGVPQPAIVPEITLTGPTVSTSGASAPTTVFTPSKVAAVGNPSGTLTFSTGGTAVIDAAPSLSATAMKPNVYYTIATLGGTDFTQLGASANTVGTKFIATGPVILQNILATSITIGHTYTITGTGTTNFVAIGAASNTVGVVFTATGVGGAGTTGLVQEVPGTLTAPPRAYRNQTGNPWSVQAYSNEYYKDACVLRCTVTNTGSYGSRFGLNSDPAKNAGYNSLDFAFACEPSGVLNIYESGKKTNYAGTYADADALEIEYLGTNILYKKNGEVVRTTKTTGGRTFWFDSSFDGPKTGTGTWSQINDIMFGTYSSTITSVFKAGSLTLNGNAQITGNSIKKVTSGSAWNTQAYSTERYIGACVLRFNFGSSASKSAAGLNVPPVTKANLADINYAIYNDGAPTTILGVAYLGTLHIYENGVDIGSFGGVLATDTFEIEYNGASVIYRKTSVSSGTTVMRTVTATTGLTLFFDSSLNNSSSFIHAIEFGRYLTDADINASSPAVISATIGGNALSMTERDRHYVYTYVTPNGEEGPPSAPVPVKCNDFQTATLAFAAETTASTGIALTNYNLGTGSKRRVYRTSQGVTTTDYLYVGEVDINTLTMDDNKIDSALGEIMPSSLWYPPPLTMDGIVASPNGFAVGFSGNTLCPSEQFLPHAYNPNNELAFPSAITGIAVTGDSLVVMTKDWPYLVTGSTPQNLSAVKIDCQQTCANKASIVNMGGHVMMASPDGLLAVTANEMAIATQSYMTREQWQAWTPSSMIGLFYEGRYMGFSPTKQFIFDTRQKPYVITELSGFDVVAGYLDPTADMLYVLSSTGQISSWETGSNLAVTWKSKPVRFPEAKCPAAARIFASGATTLQLWADNVSVFTGTVNDSNAFRLPGGYRAKQFQLQLTGSSAIDSVSIAGSIEELT